MSTWRDQAAPIIEAVLASTKGQDEKAIRRALRDAYPFCERKYWPYKVWLSEIKRQRGWRPSKKLNEAERVMFAREEDRNPRFPVDSHLDGVVG